MGFSTLLDILGSTVIGGLLFMILLRMNDTATQNTFTFAGEAQVQQNLVSVVELLEYDFRKIGYCADFTKIPVPSKAIIAADSTSIKFLTDVYPADGVVDTMRYYLGSADELSGTPNPRDKMLYRVVNSESPKGSNLGVTRFSITYFNALGNKIPFPISVPGEIYTMEIDVKVENTAAYNEEYSNAFWRQIRLAARNIRNR
ncbi:MAG: hypothetical protein Q8933_08700 [Bacteroidota bacterium]|nr:hypothetical protein [Bacteroidota bacterium]MDP4191284.1 hypothetical protein [Bacteroidota bacterium]MDP4195629.1 hypothetical protein [Bacteroidota bacterium]